MAEASAQGRTDRAAIGAPGLPDATHHLRPVATGTSLNAPEASPAPEKPSRDLRPTTTGTTLGFASAACVVLAYSFGYPALAALGLAGLAVLLCAVPLAIRRAPVELSREIYPVRVARGDTAVGLLTVRNGSSTWGQRLSARETVGRQEIPVRIGHLPPHEAIEIRYRLPTARRGLVEVGPLQWDRTDPLGLVGRRSALAGTAVLHVHPAVLPFPLEAAAQHAQGEQARTDLAPEGSITFHTLREYVPGDDLRRIHWRASAHRDQLMVRQNIDVTPPRATVVLITDADLYANADDFEHAVDVAASAAIGAMRAGQAVTIWTTAGLVVVGNGGAADAPALLDRLAAVELSTPEPDRTGSGLSGTISRIEHGERGGALIVAGGSPRPGELGALHRVASHFSVAVLARIRDDGDVVGTSANGSRALSVIDAPTAAEACDRWQRLAPSLMRSGVR